MRKSNSNAPKRVTRSQSEMVDLTTTQKKTRSASNREKKAEMNEQNGSEDSNNSLRSCQVLLNRDKFDETEFDSGAYNTRLKRKSQLTVENVALHEVATTRTRRTSEVSESIGSQIRSASKRESKQTVSTPKRRSSRLLSDTNETISSPTTRNLRSNSVVKEDVPALITTKRRYSTNLIDAQVTPTKPLNVLQIKNKSVTPRRSSLRAAKNLIVSNVIDEEPAENDKIFIKEETSSVIEEINSFQPFDAKLNESVVPNKLSETILIDPIKGENQILIETIASIEKSGNIFAAEVNNQMSSENKSKSLSDTSENNNDSNEEVLNENQSPVVKTPKTKQKNSESYPLFDANISMNKLDSNNSRSEYLSQLDTNTSSLSIRTHQELNKSKQRNSIESYIEQMERDLISSHQSNVENSSEMNVLYLESDKKGTSMEEMKKSQKENSTESKALIENIKSPIDKTPKSNSSNLEVFESMEVSNLNNDLISAEILKTKNTNTTSDCLDPADNNSAPISIETPKNSNISKQRISIGLNESVEKKQSPISKTPKSKTQSPEEAYESMDVSNLVKENDLISPQKSKSKISSETNILIPESDEKDPLSQEIIKSQKRISIGLNESVEKNQSPISKTPKSKLQTPEDPFESMDVSNLVKENDLKSPKILKMQNSNTISDYLDQADINSAPLSIRTPKKNNISIEVKSVELRVSLENILSPVYKTPKSKTQTNILIPESEEKDTSSQEINKSQKRNSIESKKSIEYIKSPILKIPKSKIQSPEELFEGMDVSNLVKKNDLIKPQELKSSNLSEMNVLIRESNEKDTSYQEINKSQKRNSIESKKSIENIQSPISKTPKSKIQTPEEPFEGMDVSNLVKKNSDLISEKTLLAQLHDKIDSIISELDSPNPDVDFQEQNNKANESNATNSSFNEKKSGNTHLNVSSSINESMKSRKNVQLLTPNVSIKQMNNIKRIDTPYPDEKSIGKAIEETHKLDRTNKIHTEEIRAKAREELKRLKSSWNKKVFETGLSSKNSNPIDTFNMKVAESPIKKSTVARNNWSIQNELYSSESELELEAEEDAFASETTDESECNSFVDDKAEEIENYESGDSMDSEERRYIEKNEIPEEGINVGSDSDSDDQDEEEEEANSLKDFIVDDDEPIELSKKTFRRIILNSSDSEEDEANNIKNSVKNSIVHTPADEPIELKTIKNDKPIIEEKPILTRENVAFKPDLNKINNEQCAITEVVETKIDSHVDGNNEVTENADEIQPEKDYERISNAIINLTKQKRSLSIGTSTNVADTKLKRHSIKFIPQSTSSQIVENIDNLKSEECNDTSIKQNELDTSREENNNRKSLNTDKSDKISLAVHDAAAPSTALPTSNTKIKMPAKNLLKRKFVEVDIGDENVPLDKRNLKKVVNTASGQFIEEAITPIKNEKFGFKETILTPAKCNFKINCIEHKQKQSKKRKICFNEEPLLLLPKPKWQISMQFDDKRRHKRPKIELGGTTFLIKPLNSKKTIKKQVYELQKYRQNLLYRSGIPREDAQSHIREKEKRRNQFN